MAESSVIIPVQDLEAPGEFLPAVECLRAQDHEAALRLLASLCRQHPDDPRGPNFLGALHYFKGSNLEAASQFSLAATIAPETAHYSYNLGCALLAAQRHEDAFYAYLQSLNSDDFIANAHSLAWTALIGVGKFQTAQTRLRQAMLAEFHVREPLPRQPTRLALPQVTVCAIDCSSPELAARALMRSSALCNFGEVKLLTSSPIHHEGIRTVRIEPIQSIEEYSRFVAKELHSHIDTDFALVIQWDGYVTDPVSWTDEFLQFDYVGAPWKPDMFGESSGNPEHMVGNGGFSLRSRRFLRAAQDPEVQLVHPEDMHLCRTYRPLIESRHGIHFGSIATAERFSFEGAYPNHRTFGFHGVINICCFETDPYWRRFEFLNAGDLN